METLKTLTQVMGIIGAVLISVAFLPQTYKLFKTKETKDLSLICYIIYQIGLILFIVYASLKVSEGDTSFYPLLAANAFGAVVNTCLLFLICYNRFSKKKIKKENNSNNVIKNAIY